MIFDNFFFGVIYGIMIFYALFTIKKQYPYHYNRVKRTIIKTFQKNKEFLTTKVMIFYYIFMSIHITLHIIGYGILANWILYLYCLTMMIAILIIYMYKKHKKGHNHETTNNSD